MSGFASYARPRRLGIHRIANEIRRRLALLTEKSMMMAAQLIGTREGGMKIDSGARSN